MKLHTASEIISFARELEGESARLYEDLSQRYNQDKDELLSLARENGKNIVQIERAYYGVITDALEGCFAFDIESDKYILEIAPAENVSYTETLNRAIAMERKIIEFYSDAAEQSKALLADVPRAFTLIAKKRSNHISKLSSLVEKRD